MKPIRCISTAVLLCLILAAPAAAERFKQTINISVSPNPTIGSTSSHNPLTYKVEGETERAETYVVYMHVLGLPEEAACPAEPSGNYQQITIPEVTVHESSVDPKHFEGKGTFPWNTYEQKGEYRVCAYLRYKGEYASKDETVISTTVLTVTESYAEAVAKEEAAAKHKAEEEAAAKHKAEEEAAAKHKAEEEAAASKRHEEEVAKAEREVAERKATETPAPAPPVVVTPLAAPPTSVTLVSWSYDHYHTAGSSSSGYPSANVGAEASRRARQVQASEKSQEAHSV